MTALARGFTVVLSFAAGAAIGFVLTFTHRQYVVELGPVTVPLGLLGGLAIVAALLAGMRLAFGERLPPIAAAAGLLVGAGILVLPGNNGSLYLETDPLGYIWVLGPTILAIVIIVWPDRRSAAQSNSAAPTYDPSAAPGGTANTADET
jgi:N-acetyl-1-D-myo-inositol-2-amino-2-deoxy-alpha-D-glucopyranoside deacetylase